MISFDWNHLGLTKSLKTKPLEAAVTVLEHKGL